MDRVFLDANVLFSAADREGDGLARLWQIDGIRLLSSAYAILEAHTNLTEGAQRDRLANLAKALEIVPPGAGLPAGIQLPAKDAPILASAIAGKATHLLTGDLRHFGALMGQAVAGVLVQVPAMYLRRRPP